MQKAVEELNIQRQSEGLPPIHAGIGMHTGPLIMGITGDDHRLDAATISDTVNTAARIESLTKYYQSPLLLSSQTLQQISTQSNYHFRYLGEVLLKGKNNLLSIFECMNGNTAERLERRIDTIQQFNEAMQCYLNKQFEKSIQLFQEIMVKDPGDHTSNIFKEKAFKYLNNGVPENWTGTEEMLSK